MDTFDVDKLMRYDVLKEEWDAVADRERKPPCAKPEHGPPRSPAPSDPKPVPPPQTSPAQVGHPASIDSLRRGQRLEFVHGIRNWHAVYWDKDAAGHVIAHNTFKDWALTHLDLHQYADKIHVESEPDPDLVRTIEQSLSNSIRGRAQAA